MGLWDDDPAFNAIANNKDLKLKRLSWQCSNLLCIECDGKIHYKVKRVVSETIDARTGIRTPVWEEFEWDTEMQSIQLESGATQNKFNTPEGSICECQMCHGRPGYDDWKARGGKPKKLAKPSKYKQNELSKEEKEGLK